MAGQSPSGTNPALSQLNFLVGEWRTELTNASFLPDHSVTLRGHTSFGWVDNGAFLAMRQFETPSGPPQAVLVIGRDQAEGNYEVLYFDRRPMSRIYHMSLRWQRLEDVAGGSRILAAVRVYGFNGQTHPDRLLAEVDR
jgi:hypothetical protein